MADIRLIVGKNIKNLRENHKISQEKLAEMIEVTTKCINQLENGKTFPKYITIERLAKALGVDTPALFAAKPVQLTPLDQVDLPGLEESLKCRLLETVNGEFKRVFKKHALQAAEPAFGGESTAGMP
jgi:transcriptional regulator with XRE-family HTH domain